MRLNRHQRISARQNILQGAHLMLEHPGAIHYTMGAGRWEGLNHHYRVARGQYPKHGDCSSTATWMLWNALTHALKDLSITDVVNGARWQAGYTGTMVEHGRPLSKPTQPGDCVFYGGGWPYHHVAVYLGGGYVFSHGSEGGPYKLPWRYRSDVRKVRRYILAPSRR